MAELKLGPPKRRKFSKLADDCHALNLNKNSGLCKIRNCNQRACWKLAVREYIVPQFYELVAITRVVDKDGHGHQILEACTAALQGAVHQGEVCPCLTLEVAGK